MQEFDVSNAPDKVSIKEAIVYSIDKTAQKKKTKIQMLTEKLDREVAYYEKSKNSFYADAKIRIENTIIGLCNELMQNGETIKDKKIKDFSNYHQITQRRQRALNKRKASLFKVIYPPLQSYTVEKPQHFASFYLDNYTIKKIKKIYNLAFLLCKMQSHFHRLFVAFG